MFESSDSFIQPFVILDVLFPFSPIFRALFFPLSFILCALFLPLAVVLFLITAQLVQYPVDTAFGSIAIGEPFLANLNDQVVELPVFPYQLGKLLTNQLADGGFVAGRVSHDVNPIFGASIQVLCFPLELSMSFWAWSPATVTASHLRRTNHFGSVPTRPALT